jgi:hypothetical protein
MKKLLLLLIIGLNVSMKAQLWFPQGAQWYYKAVTFPNTSAYVELIKTGTTTIGGKTCANLNGTYKGALLGFGPTTITIANFQNINTYEENNIVFVYNSYIAAFDTLVNFNATIGDTWKQAISANCTITPVATVIDTGHVTINGLFLKRIKVTYVNGGTNTFIEKIGSVSSFFLPYSNCLLDEPAGYFVCYSDDNFPLHDNGLGVCKFSVGLNDLDPEYNKLQIYPNPNNGLLNIQLQDASLNNCTIKLTNVLGQEVRIDEQIKQNDLISIDLGLLKKGIYFLQLFDKGALIDVEKIIRE